METAGEFGLLSWMRQAYCGLRGHDEMLQFGQERIALKCVSCGHESHGWDLNEVHPPITARVEGHRRLLARPQLVGARRIA
jgi:hypothetical protein